MPKIRGFFGGSGVIYKPKIAHLKPKKTLDKYISGASPLQMEFSEPISEQNR